MPQQTILGKIKEKKKRAKVKDETSLKTKEIKPKYESKFEKKVDNFIKKCKKRKENYACIKVWTHKKVSISEREEYFITESIVERPFRGNWDSNGGSWGMNSPIHKSNRNELEERIINFMESIYIRPYISAKKKKELKDFWFRDIKDDSVKMLFSEKALMWFGHDRYNKLKKKIEGLKGNTVTKDQILKTTKLTRLEEDINQLDDEVIKYKEELNKALNKEDANYEALEPYNRMIYNGEKKIAELRALEDKLEDQMRAIIRGGES